MKKTFLAVLVAFICLAGEGNVFADPLVWIPGVLSDTEDLVGVRYRSFATTADPEIYLGIPDLGLLANRLATEVTWAETNQVTFTYSSAEDKLTTQVTNDNGTSSLEFPGVAAAITAQGKTFAASDINFLQITIVNGGTNTMVNLNDVFLNGVSLGSFGGNGPYDWTVRDDTLNTGFTITGTLHLLGGFGNDPAASMLEIKAGHVTPNNPPDCSKAHPSKTRLWPPNHKFAKVNVLGVTDPDGDPITIRIDSIFQDEPVKGGGDGNTSPDGKGVGASSAEVRAERQGSGNGRMYHISYTADDGTGGTCTGELLVGVPKSMGKKGGPVDGGALYDSTLP